MSSHRTPHKLHLHRGKAQSPRKKPGKKYPYAGAKRTTPRPRGADQDLLNQIASGAY